MRETLLKPFFPGGEKRSKQKRRSVHPRVQSAMGVVMMVVLAIAAVVEIAIVIAEIATRARLVVHSLSSHHQAR